MSKNPAAVALGRLGGLAGKGKPKGENTRAALAAGRNKNGRPKLPRCPKCADTPRRCKACRERV